MNKPAGREQGPATQEQIDQLRRHAVNDVTRAIARDGILITDEQAVDLGEMTIDWMRNRLELDMATTDRGVEFAAKLDGIVETEF